MPGPPGSPFFQSSGYVPAASQRVLAGAAIGAYVLVPGYGPGNRFAGVMNTGNGTQAATIAFFDGNQPVPGNPEIWSGQLGPSQIVEIMHVLTYGLVYVLTGASPSFDILIEMMVS